MAGAYCHYCNHRCFVERRVPDGPHAGWVGHMATCPEGMIRDRRELGGYDHTLAVNTVKVAKVAVGDLITIAAADGRLHQVRVLETDYDHVRAEWPPSTIKVPRRDIRDLCAG